MRFTADHVRPLVEVLITMSLALQPLSKRQSCQTTKTLPAPSISADGRGPERKPPFSLRELIVEISTVGPHVVPPLVEVKASTADSLASSIGTMTVPFG